MSDWYYRTVVTVGRWPFFCSSRPIILHRDRAAAMRPPFVLASNHLAPYDVAVLMRHTPHMLDFVSITEVFRNPLMAWFYGNMNAFPLERSRSDPKTVKIILDRLARGRAVAMFPEGRIRAEEDSVLLGKPFKPGVARLARMAGVPILPVAVWGTGAYSRPASWAPIRRTVYGVAYGEPIEAGDEAAAEKRLAEAWPILYQELVAAGCSRAGQKADN